MITALIQILVICVVAGLILYVIRTLLPLSAPLANVIEVVVVVIAVLAIVVILLRIAGVAIA
jgi:hypothetical protein